MLTSGAASLPLVGLRAGGWLKNGPFKMMSHIHESRGSAQPDLSRRSRKARRRIPLKNDSVIHHSVEPPSRSQSRVKSPHYSKTQRRFPVFPKNVRFLKQMSVF